jgi:hypothetical protein
MANSGEYNSWRIGLSAGPRSACGLSCIALFMFVIAASLLNSGCRGTGAVPPATAQEVDLMTRLMPVPDPGLNGANVVGNLAVIRKGLRREALVLIAPVSVRSTLAGVSGQRMLKGWATPVFNVGDGLQMNLFLLGPGGRRFVGGRYFDAGRKFEDREWIPIAFPLDLGQDDQLEIEVSAGPQENSAADWLALSSLHLTQRKTTP